MTPKQAEHIAQKAIRLRMAERNRISMDGKGQYDWNDRMAASAQASKLREEFRSLLDKIIEEG